MSRWETIKIALPVSLAGYHPPAFGVVSAIAGRDSPYQRKQNNERSRGDYRHHQQRGVGI